MHLLSNEDGSSCFLNALLFALFAPQPHPPLDEALLGRSAAAPVLQAVARAVRSRGATDYPRPLRAALCAAAPGGARFAADQQDPAEFLQYLLGDQALFFTTLSVRKVYAARSELEPLRVEPQRFESVASGGVVTDLGSAFPRVQEEADMPANEYNLVSKQVRTDFLRGHTLIFTREKVPGTATPIRYGERDPVTRAFTIDVATADAAATVRMQLAAVVVWQGGACTTSGASAGHYAAYAYDASQRQWLFFDDAITPLPVTETPETWPPRTPHATYGLYNGVPAVHDAQHNTITIFNSPQEAMAHRLSPWRPSVHGVMFIYVTTPYG